MKCEYCDNEVPPGSVRCPSCGAAVKAGPVPQAPAAPVAAPAVPAGGVYVAAQPAPAVNVVLNLPPKSRATYVVLAIFFGGLGIHNFYAGYAGRGVAQLLLSLIFGSFTCGIVSLIVWLWAIIEACVTSNDGRGVPFN